MNNIAYLLSSGLLMLVFTGYYFLVIQRQKNFRVNRWILMLLPVVALIIPTISFEHGPDAGLISIALDTFVAGEGHSNSIFAGYNFNLFKLIPIIYLGVVVFLFFQLVLNIRKTILIINNSEKDILHGVSVYVNKHTDDAFTFINKIVVPDKNTSIYILNHELWHVKQKHFIDLFLAEALCILFWFIPGIRIYKKAIVMNHEFSADDFSGTQGNIDLYCEQLLSQVFHVNSFKACHTFNNHSITKSRIIMMYKKTTSPLKAFMSYSLIIPFVVFAVLFASAKSTAPSGTPSTTITSNEEDIVMPQFPGGTEALYKYMGENVRFTDAAKAEGKEGTVFVTFVVAGTGKIENVKVAKGVSDELDNEAMRVVNAMPDWIPGTKDGKKVNMEMTLPIKFLMK